MYPILLVAYQKTKKIGVGVPFVLMGTHKLLSVFESDFVCVQFSLMKEWITTANGIQFFKFGYI